MMLFIALFLIKIKYIVYLINSCLLYSIMTTRTDINSTKLSAIETDYEVSLYLSIPVAMVTNTTTPYTVTNISTANSTFIRLPKSDVPQLYCSHLMVTIVVKHKRARVGVKGAGVVDKGSSEGDQEEVRATVDLSRKYTCDGDRFVLTEFSAVVSDGNTVFSERTTRVRLTFSFVLLPTTTTSPTLSYEIYASGDPHYDRRDALISTSVTPIPGHNRSVTVSSDEASTRSRVIDFVIGRKDCKCGYLILAVRIDGASEVITANNVLSTPIRVICTHFEFDLALGFDQSDRSAVVFVTNAVSAPPLVNTFDYRFYVSTDSRLDAFDWPISRISSISMDSKSRYEIDANYTIPSDIPNDYCSAYYVLLAVDVRNRFTESDETNNVVHWPHYLQCDYGYYS